MSNKLSSFIASFSRRYAPAIITILLLAGFFFYYFNVVIANNESEMKERKFRGLYRMAINLTRKLESYIDKNVPNFLYDTLKRPGQYSATFSEREYGLKKIEFQKDVYPQRIEIFKNVSSGRELLFGTPTTMAASVDVEKFVDPILRRDIFSHYTLSLNDTTLFDELNLAAHQISGHQLMPGVTDSIVEGNVKHTGRIINIEIGGKQYKLFSIPFTLKGRYHFQVGGYIPIEEYEGERQSIPTYAILWLIIGIVTVILMIPLLKIFMMHSSEQLLTKNAAAALASVHILFAVIILAILNTYIYFTVVRQATEDKLKQLAEQVDQNFRLEVKTFVRELRNAQNSLKGSAVLSDLVYNRVTDSFQPPGKNNREVNYARPTAGFKDFKNIIWVDSTGMQQFRWTTDSFISRKIDVKERDYFKAVKGKSVWSDEDNNLFYLSSISSWIANRNLSMVATPINDSVRSSRGVKNLMMVGLSARLGSAFDVIFPHGFGYCIIKPDGEVIFHLDENRNLNENIVKECRDNVKLTALLQNRSSGFFGCKSSGTHQRFYVMPIAGMPYAVVTFKDMKLTWSEDLDVISACSVLVLVNLAIIIIAMITVRIGSLSSTQFANPVFLFSWLRPDKKLKKEYIFLCFFYLGAIIIMLFTTLIYAVPDQLALVGTVFSYSYLLLGTSYHQLTMNTNRNIFLGNTRRAWLSVALIYFFTVILFSLNLTSGLEFYLLSQFSLLALYFMMALVPVKQIKSLVRLNLRIGKSFAWWYTVFVYFFIVASSVVPLAIFYYLCYREERVMSLKYTQFEFAEKFIQHPHLLNQDAADSVAFGFKAPVHFKTLATRISYLDSIVKPEFIDNRFTSFYKAIKPSFSAYSLKMENLETRESPAKLFSWKKSIDQVQLEYIYEITRVPIEPGGKQALHFIADRNTVLLRPPDLSSGNFSIFILFLGCLVGILWLLYFVVNGLIRRVFFKGFVESLPTQIMTAGIQQLVPSEGNIFLYGPAGTGKFNAIQKYARDNQSKVIDIDLARLSDKEPSTILRQIPELTDAAELVNNRIMVVVQNIESHLDDQHVTQKKLDLLEGLLRKKIRIVILSSRSFDTLPIKYYSIGKPDFKDYTNRWSNILNSFYTVYHRWKGVEKYDVVHILSTANCLASKIQRIVSPQLQVSLKTFVDRQSTHLVRRIEEECAHSDFLYSLLHPALEQLKTIDLLHLAVVRKSTSATLVRKAIQRQLDIMFEVIISKLESLAQNYYLSLWESLNIDEQRTLYDISLDELVNPANRNLAVRLEELGLVYRASYLACYYPMNRSFKNFVLRRVTRNEITSFDAEVAQKGFWRSFQLPLIIVVVGVSLFLFFTQRDAFDNMIAYLGAAVAGVTGLLRLLAIIPSSKTN